MHSITYSPEKYGVLDENITPSELIEKFYKQEIVPETSEEYSEWLAFVEAYYKGENPSIDFTGRR